MATTREQIDSRGRNLLQLLIENEDALSNVMNPSSKGQNTYKGPRPDDPVEILYPRSVSNVGTEVNEYTTYFLREFNLDGLNTNLYGHNRESQGGSDGILTQAEHDRGENENVRLQGAATERFEGKQHDQPFQPNQRYTSNGNSRADFMKLKGRKSLMTLYWEMRGAFVNNSNKPYFKAQGQDGEDKTWTNRFGGSSDIDTYDGNFVAQNNELYFPPSGEGITISSSNGFVLGQVLGGDTNIIQQLIDKGAEITTEWFNDLIEDAGENEFLKSFLQTMQSSILGNGEVTRISQLYRPGWTRAQQPHIHITPLTELLQQNLLLPPNEGSLPIQNGTDESTFDQLYTSNRATAPIIPDGMIDRNRYNKGTVAGTGINDLMEPLKNFDGSLAGSGGSNPYPPPASVPFTFEEDDKVYLTPEKRHAGFTSNGVSTQTNPDAMESAVSDFQKESTIEEGAESSYRSSAAFVVGQGERQYFPFTFSTVNKKNQRVQLCTLQATIQSLGESYTPTWQSKHFFGRSEQIHTYTFTDRTIDLSFVIFADSMRQLQNVYERVLWLSQQCYPDYNSNDRISSGPIIAIRIGDLFQYKAGFIRSLSYDWNFLGPGGKWELTRGSRMPQACNVTMSYQIIHEKVPDRDYNFYGGPAGGLAAGFKNLKEIDYSAATLNASDITQSEATISGERYIPTHGGVQGEQGYLNNVDTLNEATTDADLIPYEGPIDDETGQRTRVFQQFA